MIKKSLILSSMIIVFTAAFFLSACGNKKETTNSPEKKTETASEETPQDKANKSDNTDDTQNPSDEVSSTDEKTDINAYSWLGLQDIPQCNYLDILATAHYIQTYDYYTLGISLEETEAMDGVNSFKQNKNTRSYSIDGKVLSINEDSKIYMEYDMTKTIDSAKNNLETAIKNGTNMYGRKFVETGKSSIPLYSDKEGDNHKYDYYEFNYPDSEATGSNLTERYYMKDDDVFAIYQKISSGDTDIQSTKVIKNISADIPNETFVLPDLDGYKKYES